MITHRRKRGGQPRLLESEEIYDQWDSRVHAPAASAGSAPSPAQRLQAPSHDHLYQRRTVATSGLHALRDLRHRHRGMPYWSLRGEPAARSALGPWGAEPEELSGS